MKRYSKNQLDACLQLRLSGKDYFQIAELMNLDVHDVFAMHLKLMMQKRLNWKLNKTDFTVTWHQTMPKQRFHFLKFKKPAWFDRKKTNQEDSQAGALSSQTTINPPESLQNETVVKHENEQGENKAIEKENQDT